MIVNLILSLSLLFGFHDILRAMITEEDVSIYNDLMREDLKKVVSYLEKNQRFTTFSKHLEGYNVDANTIEEFARFCERIFI